MKKIIILLFSLLVSFNSYGDIRESLGCSKDISLYECMNKEKIEAEVGSVDLNIKKLKSSNACRGCDLSGANLSKLNLNGADLSKANLVGVIFFGSDLSQANLSKSNMSNANLRKANFTGANLHKSNLNGAILDRTNFSGANFDSVNLRDFEKLPRNLFDEDLSSAFLNESVKQKYKRDKKTKELQEQAKVKVQELEEKATAKRQKEKEANLARIAKYKKLPLEQKVEHKKVEVTKYPANNSSYSKVNNDVGCGSTYSKEKRQDVFNAKYKNHWMKWGGEIVIVSSDKVSLNLDNSGTQDLSVYFAKKGAGYHLREGQKIRVRFLMKSTGGCFLPFGGTNAIRVSY
tara:strand:+ start:74 stop:1111 length:1038 start_codon:yes stop_codon:yes gene_type:complete